MSEQFFPSVEVAGLHLEAPLMGGAGPIKLPKQVLEIAQSAAAAIMVGSITIEERQGNEGRTYFADPDQKFSLNSKGLPNPGVAYYQKHLPEMVQIAHDYGKPLLVSVAGFSPAEYARLVAVCRAAGVDGTEINLGCPNVFGTDGQQKQIASFHENGVGETLHQVTQAVGTDGWTSVKLSPFSDPGALSSIAKLLSRFELVKAVTTTNTFPNAFAFTDAAEPAIDPAGGLGGMAGAALKAIGLGQVKQLRAFLPTTVAVIGVGGITMSRDLQEYLLAGATAAQVTTAYITFGPSIFSQILGR